MNNQVVSLISVLVNIALTVGKIIFGIALNSAAIIAEAIHSGLDIFSSFITFLGIRLSQKPSDNEHPYGHYRAEGVAGLVVVVLLFISAIWIIYEGVDRLIHPSELSISVWALIFMGGAAVVNEVMARIKHYFGKKFSSIGLVADARHSQADVIASAGVFLGLLLIKIWTNADAIVAILVGIYILWESYKLSREVYDSLSDIVDKQAENQIKNILEGFEAKLSDIKTRKIGPATFAEIKLNVEPSMEAKEITILGEDIEKKLLSSIENLKQVAISFKSKTVNLGDIRESFDVKENLRKTARIGRLGSFTADRAYGWGLGRRGFGRGLGPGRGLGQGMGQGRGLSRGVGQGRKNQLNQK